jgi:hypothetical protein
MGHPAHFAIRAGLSESALPIAWRNLANRLPRSLDQILERLEVGLKPTLRRPRNDRLLTAMSEPGNMCEKPADRVGRHGE